MKIRRVDHFGDVLKRLREEKKLSQATLAKLSKISRSYISKLEQGIKSPKLRTIFALAAGLGMKPSELVKELEESLLNKQLVDLVGVPKHGDCPFTYISADTDESTEIFIII